MAPVTHRVSTPVVSTPKLPELPKTQAPAMEDAIAAFAKAMLKDGFTAGAVLPKTPVMLADTRPVAPSDVAFGRNPTRGSEGKMTLPTSSGRISDAAWNNPAEIVGNMRQDSTAAGDVNGDDRCGPTNLLAIAMLGGKASAVKFLETQANTLKLSPSEKAELKQIAADLKAGNGSYESLTQAQNLLYKGGNTRADMGDMYALAEKSPRTDANDMAKLRAVLDKDVSRWTRTDKQTAEAVFTKAAGKPITIELSADPRGTGKQSAFVKTQDGVGNHSALDDGEIAAHAKAGGMKATSKTYAVSELTASATDVLKSLKAGEAAVVRVALTSIEGDETPGHFVTIGKLPDGRPYIYNPSPANEDATLVIGKAGRAPGSTFEAELSKYDDRSFKDAGNVNPRYTKITP